jgi:hypothetical protein
MPCVTLWNLDDIRPSTVVNSSKGVDITVGRREEKMSNPAEVTLIGP